jgi:molybdopterin converting factor subunit 1
MTIVVLYFAALRELLGVSEETVSITGASINIDALAEQLAQSHPALRGHLSSVRFAVNESFVNGTAEVLNGDIVALIPPVSGG